MTRSEEDQKIANQMFDKLRDDLLSRDLSNTESYDKAILALSSSTLGLSLTAIKFVVPITTASYVFMLKLSWATLLVSVICSLAAYLISNKAIQIQLNNARDYYKNGIEDAFHRKNKYTTINSALNITTGATFSLAIFLTVIFITINIENGDLPVSDKKQTGVTIERSANIPSMETVSTPIDNATNSANVPTMEQAPSTATTSQGGGSSEGKK